MLTRWIEGILYKINQFGSRVVPEIVVRNRLIIKDGCWVLMYIIPLTKVSMNCTVDAP